MVGVKGNSGTSIASVTNLGLSMDAISVSPRFVQEDMMVDAYGGGLIPADVQQFLADVTISMNLVHFDPDVLDVCIRETCGSQGIAAGTMNRTGARLGGGNARFAAGWHYVSLNITSPVAGKPFRFYNCYIVQPFTWPMGTHKSPVVLTWRAIPYTTDPWGGGIGSFGQVLWDNTLDV